MKSKIAIIGFGKLGRALADVLEAKKESCLTCAWDIVKTGDHREVDKCDEAVKDAIAVFVVVPSAFFSESLNGLLGCVDKNTVLVSCVKGLDDKTGNLPIKLLEKNFPKNPVAVLSGPMLSEELKNGLPTRAVIASKKSSQVKQIIDLFQGTSLILAPSNDPIGSSFYGILKNIYALALGLSDGLELGANFKSCLALQAAKEMKKIVKSAGGKDETFLSEAGLADFLATGYSPKSRNYSYGFKKAKGEELNNELVEGVKNLEAVLKTTEKIKLPLLLAVKNIFLNNQDPKTELLKLSSFSSELFS